MAYDGRERRRGDIDPDDFITYRDLRSALQPLFDQKARVEPALRFFEAMRLMGLEELLPDLLKEERTRQVLRSVSTASWKRWTRLFAVAGGVFVLLQIVEAVIVIAAVLKI